MPKNLTDKQLEALTNASSTERYEHAIKQIADEGCLWTLKAPSGYVTCSDAGNGICIPVWPHPAYASKCAYKEWADARPVELDIHDFLSKWIPGLRKDKRHLAVFPVSDGVVVSVSPDHFEQDLCSALAEIE